MTTLFILSVVLFLTSCLISAALLYHNADSHRTLVRVQRSSRNDFRGR